MNHNWKLGEPTESEELLTFDDNKAYLLGMSERYLAVKVMRESSRRITRRQKMLPPTFHSVMIIVNLENKERQEILIDKGSEHSLDRVYFLSSAVIGELKSSWGLSLGSMRAWDIGSQEEIFSKEYPTQFALSPLYDANSQEVVLNSMVNGNPGIVRLNTDDDNSVKETFFDSSNIGGVVAFSSPYLLCHHPSLENTFNVCKIVENKVEIVSTLEIPDLYFNKLAISNSYIVKVTSRPFPSQTISIWRLTSGEVVKKINLPPPFPLESPSLSGILLSYTHLIVRMTYTSNSRRNQMVLLYDIEELVTQKKFKPRHFITDDFHRFGDSLEAGCMMISQNKTKLLVCDEYGCNIKFHSWNFWKSAKK